MNPIDRMVHWFNPEAGKRRIGARIAAQAMMTYDAASRGRRTKGWKAPATAADAAAYGARERLRNLSRDVVRNRPFGARGRDVVVANVVGPGIVPSVISESARTTAEIGRLIKDHLLTSSIDSLGEYDLYEMQAIAMAAVFTDGEVLLRRRIRNPRFARGLAMPWQVELLEADYLDTRLQSWGENPVIEGVEYGPTGAIEAYHLLSEHPGAVRHRKAPESTRVHWSDVLHLRRFDRPGQLRGVPWLAPAMLTLGELSDYQEAQILKQKVAALMAVILEVEGVQKDEIGLDGLSPGAVVQVPEGTVPHFTDPPKVDGYEEFMRAGLRAVAMSIGVTYESLTGDLNSVNFSSARMGRTEMDRLVKMWQRNLMIAQLGTGLERWLREGLLLMGRSGHGFSLEWTPPRRMLVDPTKEIPAMLREVQGGLTSLQRQQRELGYDPETIRRERAEDAAAGAMPAPGAGTTGQGGGATAQTGQGGDTGEGRATGQSDGQPAAATSDAPTA